jgi:Fur family peroxide stress response transcriptional regulator
MTTINPIDILKENNISITVQRFKILEMIINSHKHPTAEDIYNKLLKDTEILSFATVYNTLRLFCKVGIIEEVRIEKDRVHYDYIRRPHNHLLCYKCNKIIDIYEEMVLTDIPEMIDGHKIEKAHIYYYGTCRKCLNDRL